MYLYICVCTGGYDSDLETESERSIQDNKILSAIQGNRRSVPPTKERYHHQKHNELDVDRSPLHHQHNHKLASHRNNSNNLSSSNNHDHSGADGNKSSFSGQSSSGDYEMIDFHHLHDPGPSPPLPPLQSKKIQNQEQNRPNQEHIRGEGSENIYNEISGSGRESGLNNHENHDENSFPIPLSPVMLNPFEDNSPDLSPLPSPHPEPADPTGYDLNHPGHGTDPSQSTQSPIKAIEKGIQWHLDLVRSLSQHVSQPQREIVLPVTQPINSPDYSTSVSSSSSSLPSKTLSSSLSSSSSGSKESDPSVVNISTATSAPPSHPPHSSSLSSPNRSHDHARHLTSASQHHNYNNNQIMNNIVENWMEPFFKDLKTEALAEEVTLITQIAFLYAYTIKELD